MCTHVAIERTGVYWRPVVNVLRRPLAVLLVNAHHIKAVPGRKPDVRDCDGIGDLLRHGLLKASFMPPRHIREWRELTRHRPILVRDRAAVATPAPETPGIGEYQAGTSRHQRVGPGLAD